MSIFIKICSLYKIYIQNDQAWWLMTVILATQKAEIGRITVQGYPRQKVGVTPSQPIKSWAW
jgi:hypothetical protein